jgi:large subunit ribosomal protein L25
MSELFELQAQVRKTTGKAAARRMRRVEGIIPGIIYGAKKDPVQISLQHKEVSKALENEAFYSHVLTIQVGKKPVKAVLKALQRHAFKPTILHMDFLRIDAKAKLTMRVPLHFLNEETATGVKQDGGRVTHHVTDVEVSCLPANLPEYLEIDLADVGIEQTVRLSNIVLPKGVEIVSLTQEAANDLPVASINAQKVEEEISSDAPLAPETEVKQSGEEKEEKDDADKKAKS